MAEEVKTPQPPPAAAPTPAPAPASAGAPVPPPAPQPAPGWQGQYPPPPQGYGPPPPGYAPYPPPPAGYYQQGYYPPPQGGYYASQGWSQPAPYVRPQEYMQQPTQVAMVQMVQLPLVRRPISMKTLRRRAPFFLFLGILMICVGIVMCLLPIWHVQAFVMFTGVVLLVLGLTNIGTGLYTAIHDKDWCLMILDLLLAVLNIIVGMMLITNWVNGYAALTYIVGYYLLFTGILELFLACAVPGPAGCILMLSGWCYIIMSSFLLSYYYTPAWFIGLLIGLYFVGKGIGLVAMAAEAKKLYKEQTAAAGGGNVGDGAGTASKAEGDTSV